MRLLRTAPFVLLFLSGAANSQSHCGVGETDYFSCETSTKRKVASICGNIREEENTATSWLQYRFGRLEKIELIYPNNKSGSLKKFEANNFIKYGTVSIRFINGDALFDLTVSTDHEVDGEKIAGSSGITVTLNKDRYFNIPCKKVTADRLTSLAMELERRNGQTDFLYQFLNRPPK